MALAVAGGCNVTAHHVDHGLRPDSTVDVDISRRVGAALGVDVVVHRVAVEPGPNLEMRARTARYAVLPAQVMTGHTADDQAETVLLQLLRGAGADGLGAMRPGPRRPLLRIRRHETRALCETLGLPVATDPSNVDTSFRRNRIRADVLPLLADVAERDVVTLLTRAADLVRDDADLLDELAAGIDPTDACALAEAPVPLARRALRRWLSEGGYPPDAAAIERVLDVARGGHVACELVGGRRVERSRQRLRVVPIDH